LERKLLDPKLVSQVKGHQMSAAGAHLHADTGNHNHPFHMHTNHFQVLEYRNATGWPDVLGQWVLH
jgi:hypothetical protein